MRTKQKLKLHNKIVVKVAFGVIIFYIVFLIISSVKNSLFFSRPDRTNILFYGEKTIVLSYGFTDGVHYLISFPSDLHILIPGGYGTYKIGSLGKLSQLQKNPFVLKNAFSSAISASIEYVFYPEKSRIYERAPNQEERPPSLALLDIAGFRLSTNAPILDRLYLFFLLGTKRRSDFIGINPVAYAESVKNGETLFSEEDFFKKYIGYFYHKRLRQEQKNVQILYTKNYTSALGISRVIEGEGIRVVDISKTDNRNTSCIIKEKAPYSKTSLFLRHLFSCAFQNETREGSDIQLYLGEAVEREWE